MNLNATDDEQDHHSAAPWHGGCELQPARSESFLSLRRSEVTPTLPRYRCAGSQGKTVLLVNIDDLYDEFSFGKRNPSAIRDFLLTTSSRWQVKPKYLSILAIILVSASSI
jgi:hypothetical protein